MNTAIHVTRSALSLLAAVALAGCVTAPAPAPGDAGTPTPGAAGNTGPIPPHIPHSPVPWQQPAAATAATPIVIQNNHGGNVVQMMAYRSQLASSGRPVEIRGKCNSACTMLTTLPNACLAPDATIGFHAPRIPNTQIIPPIVDQMMATTYRNGIRARWFSEWRHSLVIQSITAREYVALDPMTRLCAR